MNAIAEKTEQKTIARLDWHTLIDAAEGTPPETLKALDAYFEAFAQPIFQDGDKTKNMVCIECDKPLDGLMAVFLGSGFTWGITHGEGHCSACKWPARGHHFIKDAGGKDVATIRNFVLQYHPDFVERRA